MIQCTICLHPECTAIDTLLASGERPQEAIASEYGLSQSAVSRHLREHRPDLLARTAEEQAAPLVGRVDPSLTAVLDRLTWLDERLAAGLTAVIAAKDWKLVPRYARELIRVAEVRLRHHRGLPSDNPAVSEARGAVEAFQELILRALADHPEARARVADALMASAPSPEVPPTHE